jgi:acyl carrier protein
MTSSEQIKAHILEFVNESVELHGSRWLEVSDDFDLRLDGALDSLRFIQLIADLEAYTGAAIDLADLDPEQLTIIGVLSRHIAAQITPAHVARP